MSAAAKVTTNCQTWDGSNLSYAPIELSAMVFGCRFNEPLVHQVLIAQQAGQRSGTKAQKSRAQVRGGGAKPWRQKGTGRARAGTISSPIWRSGGKTFATSGRKYAPKVNRKMYRGALRALLSELLRQERLKVIAEFKLDTPKTKECVQLLAKHGWSNGLLVIASPEPTLMLAARNLPDLQVMLPDQVTFYDLLKPQQVIFTEAAIRQLEAKLECN